MPTYIRQTKLPEQFLKIPVMKIRENDIMMTNNTKTNVFTGENIVATGKLVRYTRNGINDRIMLFNYSFSGKTFMGRLCNLVCPFTNICIALLLLMIVLVTFRTRL